MKLPNCLTSAQWGLPSLAVMILLFVCSLEHAPSASANHHQEPIATNEILTASQSHQVAAVRTNFSQFSRDVTDLRLWPDLRSIKLRWNYKHSEQNRPKSFKIRYCELTSWMAEIKCRHKEMPVRELQPEFFESPKQSAKRLSPANDSNSTVITMASVQSVAPHLFETQIFDLRALTNYTFHVQVARFVDEPAQAFEVKPVAIARQRPSRRLDLARENALTNLISADSVELAKIETTKPFSAEALKCLADSSEVLVNTGRYFGGRISVEGQQDGRCQLMGNKSSEQAIYTFHIDHQACHSKVMDGNRIETMILVHENKEILTHNTARFLVQCNIGQESFTVKASISLPKVINNLASEASSASRTRPAMITPLGSKPFRSPVEPTGEWQNFDRVHLGSMPGVYRLIRSENRPTLAQALTNSAGPLPTSNYLDGAQTTATTSGGARTPLQTAPATIATGETTTTFLSASRQLVASQTPASPLASRSQRQSKGLTASDLLLALPKPVDVSSKILFVERAADEASAVSAPIAQREPRLMAKDWAASNERVVATAEKQGHRQPVIKRENSSKLTLSNGATSAKENEDVSEPVVVTNNHRVAGDFMMLDQHPSSGFGQRALSTDQQDGSSEFSIKYSANKVDGYSLNKLQQPFANFELTTQTSQTARSRAARMRQIDSAEKSTDSTSALPKLVVNELGSGPSRAIIESRMGDVAHTTRHDVLATEASSPSEQIARLEPSNASTNSTIPALTAQATLAHNITGAIIRWSLKTLGNLARKSLESLVVDEHDGDSEGRNREIDARQSTGPAFITKTILSPPTTTFVTRPLSPSHKPTPKAIETAALDSNVNESPGIEPSRIDGFVVDSRPLVESTTTTTTIGLPGLKSIASLSSRPQASRVQSDAIKYLPKSLDASDHIRGARHEQQESDVRQTLALLKQRQTASKLAAEKVVAKSAGVGHNEQELGVSERHSKENPRSLWPLYGLWALCGLISLIVATIYLVLMSPKTRPSFVGHTITSMRQQNDESRKPTGHLVRCLNEAFQRHSPAAMAPTSTHSIKINSSLNSPSSFGRHVPTTAQVSSSNTDISQKTIGPSSSPTGSAATWSTSVASSALSSPSGRENHCKEEEQCVVYTDYLVLTDNNSSLTDDHQCLTRAGQRGRPPSESFA